MSVHDGEHHDLAVQDAEVELRTGSAQDRAPHFAADAGQSVGRSAIRANDGVHFSDEVVAERGPSLLVPVASR